MSHAQPVSPAPGGLAQSLRRPIQVIVVSSVMFTFISYWRTAAVVLCDLASTAYYIGGIVENAIGPAAPWFILAVMLFSYAVRSVYIESCSLFVRGGVYRVVKEALGGFLAKLSVSALMFDFILTGPTSGMSAGQYIMGLLLDTIAVLSPELAFSHETAAGLRNWGAVLIACLITLYFFRQNLIGIHESSGKALKIMIATTVMAVVMLSWCGVTLLVRGPINSIPTTPNLDPKVEYAVVKGPDRVTGEMKEMWKRDPDTQKLVPARTEQGLLVPKINEATGHQEDPLGFVSNLAPSVADGIRKPQSWWHLLGVIGLLIAFGHSVLAMSGEETLAQVYREIEAPKLPNLKKAAFIVFLYSVLLTVSISFLAVALIPDEVRMKVYGDNLIGGLAMYVLGPSWLRLLLNGFVVVIGFLILAGGVNTAIIGSSGVLHRVAEDGVLPEWFLKPHQRYGTTHRVLYLIVTLQLIAIIASRGDMYVLGEAYAFGVVWSFVFQALAMVVLRFRDRSPREFKVPLNIRIRGVEFPLGLSLIFLILLATAILNFLTKEVATVAGTAFTAMFLVTFVASEAYHNRKRGPVAYRHLEQFNQQTADEISRATIGLDQMYCKLVAIRSPQNLFMLEKALSETDPETTDVVVMTAKAMPRGSTWGNQQDFDHYDRELMTAVVNRAEGVGKHVVPLIMPTNNPLYAVVNTAKNLGAQEIIIGASNKYTANEQLEQIAFYWINVHGGQMSPLTVRILSRDMDVGYDLGGGNRIPKISERKARSIAELRSSGIGVSRALLVHFDRPESSDLFEAILTMLDPKVQLTLVALPIADRPAGEASWVQRDVDRAEQWHRELELHRLTAEHPEEQLVQLAQQKQYDVLIIGLSSPLSADEKPPLNVDYLMRHSPAWVCVAAPPAIPSQAEEAPATA